jgi:hypothetical protein
LAAALLLYTGKKEKPSKPKASKPSKGNAGPKDDDGLTRATVVQRVVDIDKKVKTENR